MFRLAAWRWASATWPGAWTRTWTCSSSPAHRTSPSPRTKKNRRAGPFWTHEHFMQKLVAFTCKQSVIESVKTSVADPWHFSDPCLCLTNRDPTPDPDPAIFVSKLRGWKLNFILFFSKVFAYYFLKLHLHNFSKSQTVGIKVFLTIFAWWWRYPVPDLYLLLMHPSPEPGGSKTYGSGSATTVKQTKFLLPS
jgi:hypothetical protein